MKTQMLSKKTSSLVIIHTTSYIREFVKFQVAGTWSIAAAAATWLLFFLFWTVGLEKLLKNKWLSLSNEYMAKEAGGENKDANDSDSDEGSDDDEDDDSEDDQSDDDDDGDDDGNDDDDETNDDGESSDDSDEYDSDDDDDVDSDASDNEDDEDEEDEGEENKQ